MIRRLTAAAILAGLLATTPASAQTTNDDVQCFLLSIGFSRDAKEESTRRVSAMTGAFFLGRLQGRVPQATLVAAIRAQGGGMPVAKAGPIMRACAARAAAAQAQMEAAAKMAGPTRPAAKAK